MLIHPMLIDACYIHISQTKEMESGKKQDHFYLQMEINMWQKCYQGMLMNFSKNTNISVYASKKAKKGTLIWESPPSEGEFFEDVHVLSHS